MNPKSAQGTVTTDELRVGDYIEVPSCHLAGRALDVQPSSIGRNDAIVVRLQEYPQQPLDDCGYYRIEQGKWRRG